MRSRRPLGFAVFAATLLVASGCATAASPGGSILAGGDPLPTPSSSGDVLAQGTVLQVGDAAPQLCLGPVAQSLPPQCSGPEVIGWDWSAIDMKDMEADVTWGTFAVTGTWDGSAFTATGDPIPLALFDPAPTPPDPRADPSTPGAGDAATLLRIEDDLQASAGESLLGTFASNGYLFASVVFDDGTVQDFVDEQFGADLVAVQSTLTPVD